MNLTIWVNTEKVIAYGQSHGAYLAYLCNAFAQDLFSLIIDNSAWLFPVYLTKIRTLTSSESNLTININYLAKSNKLFDEELLYLPYLYCAFENKCKIICFHGVNDSLINIHDKKNFGKKINKFIFNGIMKEKVDGKTFTSAEHGLGANFLKMFDLVMKKQKFAIGQKEQEHPILNIKTKQNLYSINCNNIDSMIVLNSERIG